MHTCVCFPCLFLGFHFLSLGQQAWAESRSEHSYETAMKLLQHLRSLFSDGGPHAVRPNLVLYNTMLKVIEKCPFLSDKTGKARYILTLMKQDGLVPNARTYNAMIRACGAVQEGDEENDAVLAQVLEGTREALERLRSASLVDSYTYPGVFQVCSRLLSKTHPEFVEQAFGWCCEDQRVDGRVLFHVKNAMAKHHPEVLNRMFGVEKNGASCKLHDFPRAWRRKAAQQRKKRTNRYRNT